MNKQEIATQLKEKHQLFIEYISSLNNNEFIFSKMEKWTAGQQLEHICLSTMPVLQALSIPKWIVKIIFGKANRPSKSYEELVKKYLDKLDNGGKASGRFVPKIVNINQKGKLTQSLTKTINSLASKINNFSEEELDTLLLPHPLLGKLTMREMLYFTIHHVQQHQQITQRNLLK